MALLRWFKRGEGEARLVDPMSEEEMEIWKSLAEALSGSWVLPLVPIGLVVEGAVPERVASEVVPFMVLDGRGKVQAAYFYEASEGMRFLKALGLPCGLVEEVLARAPTREEAEEVKGEEEQEEAPPEASPPPSPPVDPPVREEERKEAKASEATESLAALWWRGEVSAEALARMMVVREEGEGEAEERSPAPAPPEKGTPEGGSPPSCPLCGSPMVLKVARKGKRAGQEFWSCSRYPDCKGARPKR